jgi:membrane fusion protein (multidrug efflux system)
MLSMEAELTEIKSHTTTRLYDKDSLAEQRNTLRIIAPNTAVITEIAVGQGEYVNKGDMLGQSVNTRTIHVVAYYNEDSLAHIKPGDTVNVHIEALKRTITGRIRAIGALAGGSAASASVNYTTGYVARVKQRVPVYIDAASAKERALLQQLPLGLSIRVSKP